MLYTFELPLQPGTKNPWPYKGLHLYLAYHNIFPPLCIKFPKNSIVWFKMQKHHAYTYQVKILYRRKEKFPCAKNINYKMTSLTF